MIEHLFKMEMYPWGFFLIVLGTLTFLTLLLSFVLFFWQRRNDRIAREELEKQANNLELGTINSGTILLSIIFLKNS